MTGKCSCYPRSILCGSSLLMAFIVACSSSVVPGASQTTPSPKPVDSLDVTLFAAVLHKIWLDSSRYDLRIDPRPLRNDPRLVTLRPMDVMADRVEPDLWRTPLAEDAAVETQARRALLQQLGVLEADGLKPQSCPGVLVPGTPEAQEQRRRYCPEKSYQIVMIALPRAGGSYWPNNVDERSKYAEHSIVSVRIIVSALSIAGSVEHSSDYVFAHRGSSGWQLLEVRSLLIVE